MQYEKELRQIHSQIVVATLAFEHVVRQLNMAGDLPYMLRDVDVTLICVCQDIDTALNEAEAKQDTK